MTHPTLCRKTSLAARVLTCGYGCCNVAAAIKGVEHHCVPAATTAAAAGYCRIVLLTGQNHNIRVG